VKSCARRSYAAFSAVVAIAAGTIVAVTHDASAASSTRPAVNGRITMDGFGDGTGISLCEADGTSDTTLPGSGLEPARSPSGSRIASVAGGRIVTRRADGTGLKALPGPQDGGVPRGPAYWDYGHGLVCSSAAVPHPAVAPGSHPLAGPARATR
jgi:hypothetical protein